MEQKTLKEIIAERFESKGLNIEKAFQLTGVPKHYLELMIKGEWQKMPAAPYAKGYFKKLEELLEFEVNHLWNLYQSEAELKASGAEDRLPGNRFAIKKSGKKWLWPVLVALAGIIYLSFNAARLMGVPKLEIDNPLSASAITYLPNFVFTGQINPKDKLLINQEEIYVDKDGKFQEDYKLQPGLNTFEFIAKKFLGKEIKVVKQIIYQSEENKK